MAILWRKIVKNKAGERVYEVRRAGQSVRLYTDGIFHSQWNAARPFSGHLWDLLFLPVLLNKEVAVTRSALILGVGGGSLINLLNRFLDLDRIDGVDVDELHLTIAKRYFLSDAANTHFFHCDAPAYVSAVRRKYNVVVDDLFLGMLVKQNSPSTKLEAVRPIPVDRTWLLALKRCLAHDGVLIINFESEKQLRASLKKSLVVPLGFKCVYEFASPRYENAIAAVTFRPISKHQFKQQVARFLEAQPKTAVKDLEYSATRIF